MRCDGNGYQYSTGFPSPTEAMGLTPMAVPAPSPLARQTLYGATSVGMINDSGTTCRLPILFGQYPNVLHSFDSGANQGHPWGRVLQVGDYLYGMTVNGGANLVGTVYGSLPWAAPSTSMNSEARATADSHSGTLPYRATEIPSME